MIINVNPALLELIKTLEAQEIEAFGESEIPLSFGWSYGEGGNTADGESCAWRPHARYTVSVSPSGSVDVYRDELDKYSNDGWAQHPLSTDYEEDEE